MHFCVDIITAPFWEHQGFWQCWLPLCFKGLKTTEPPHFPFGGDTASFVQRILLLFPSSSKSETSIERPNECLSKSLSLCPVPHPHSGDWSDSSVSQWCLPSLLPTLLQPRDCQAGKYFEKGYLTKWSGSGLASLMDSCKVTGLTVGLCRRSFSRPAGWKIALDVMPVTESEARFSMRWLGKEVLLLFRFQLFNFWQTDGSEMFGRISQRSLTNASKSPTKKRFVLVSSTRGP